MKTIRQWLDIGLTADEKVSLQAVILNNPTLPDRNSWETRFVDTFSEAVTTAMVWDQTPQGHEYWCEIFNQNRQPTEPVQETNQQTNMSTQLTTIQGRSIVTLWNGHLALKDNSTPVVVRLDGRQCDSWELTDNLSSSFVLCTIGDYDGRWLHIDLASKSYFSDHWFHNDECHFTNRHRQFHEDEQSDFDIVWCDYDDEYAEESDTVYGWVSRRQEGYIIPSRSECYSDRDDVYFASIDIANGRDYYWCNDADDYLHSDDIPCDDDDDDDDNCVRGYHHFTRVNAYERDTPKWTIGYEVEKEDRGAKTLNDAVNIYDAIKWCHESDGSLDSHSGFEIVSPVFDLYDTTMIQKHFNHPMIKPLLDAAGSESCGGHINIASTMYTPSQLADGLTAWFPLLYAMYQNRLDKTYSKAKTKHKYFESRDKYSSVYIKDNVVEFRIFPLVKNADNLWWRTELMRIFVENINKSEIDVLRMMLNSHSRLHKHLCKVFTADKIFEKANLYIKYSEMYNGRKLSMPKKKNK